jgi:hypothetical protein
MMFLQNRLYSFEMEDDIVVSGDSLQMKAERIFQFL